MTLDEIIKKAHGYRVTDMSGEHNLGEIMDQMRNALKKVYIDSMRCGGDSASMAMCVVSTQFVAREALGNPASKPEGE